ncbi:hypothetical protein H0X10_02065 [Candidatus Saccharibacteria bacterium]|nr:hypothetical protein [Candidatus Saccharibacteria bacterium]
MAKTKSSKKIATQQSDSAYFLKLVLYVIVGSQWLWITTADGASQIPLPLGFVIGLMFASHDHFQIDRKIEYAVLLIGAIISFWFQVGIFVNL